MDASTSCQTLFFAFQVLIELARRSGSYTAKDLAVMQLIAKDFAHPVISMRGDLFELPGCLTSGNSLTADLNSLSNSLYHRACFHHFFPLLLSFRLFVLLASYGDDVVFSSPILTGEMMSKFCEVFGLKYTPADKTSTDFRPKPLTQVTFLKRGFRKWHWGGHAFYTSTLSKQSVFKSLAYYRNTATSPGVAVHFQDQIPTCYEHMLSYPPNEAKRELVFLQQLNAIHAHKHDITAKELRGRREVFKSYLDKNLTATPYCSSCHLSTKGGLVLCSHS